MTPADLLDLAGELATGSTEAAWRAAVSRAYYAAFHAARNFFRQAGFEVPRGDRAHAYLWMRLSNSGHPDLNNAGDILNELRGARNLADYDIDRPFSDEDLSDQLADAGVLVQLLEAVPSVPAVLQATIDAICVYERTVLREVTWRASGGSSP